MSDADEESRRMATRSTRNNSGALSSSSSTAPTTLRVVASIVTEPTQNMPTTPAQLTEMIASAVATALTDQQPVNRDLFNTAASGTISNASILLEVIFLDQQLMKFLQIYTGKHHQLPMRLSSGVACQIPTQIIISRRPQYWLFWNLRICWHSLQKLDQSLLKHHGYLPRRCITNIKGEEATINSDDEYLYRHNINRLYLAMTICISNEIQYLCPVAIATTCGITLWAFSNNH